MLANRPRVEIGDRGPHSQKASPFIAALVQGGGLTRWVTITPADDQRPRGARLYGSDRCILANNATLANSMFRWMIMSLSA